MIVIYEIVFFVGSLYLAALHFNENTSQLQATTAEGQSRFKTTLPKAKKGQNRVYEANTEPTFCMYNLSLFTIY